MPLTKQEVQELTLGLSKVLDNLVRESVGAIAVAYDGVAAQTPNEVEAAVWRRAAETARQAVDKTLIDPDRLLSILGVTPEGQA